MYVRPLAAAATVAHVGHAMALDMALAMGLVSRWVRVVVGAGRVRLQLEAVALAVLAVGLAVGLAVWLVKSVLPRVPLIVL